MSQSRLQKLNALLARVEERRAAPRLHAVAQRPAELAEGPRAPQPAPVPTPAAPPALAPAASMAPSAASIRPAPDAGEAPRRGPSSSPLEDAMAQLPKSREDSGPLAIESLSSPITAPERPSEPEPLVNQDLVLTHRPQAGSLPGPLVEFVQPRPHAHREPTLQFDTGVKANPLLERELKAEPAAMPADAVLSAPTERLEPQPLSAHAAPVRVVSSARQESAKSFGELLDLSLSLRPAAR